MGYYNRPDPNRACSAINYGALAPNTFELRHHVINYMKQDTFYGMKNEDAHQHLTSFKEKAGSIKHNGVTKEQILLMLFPITLKDNAKRWLNSHEPGTFTTWEVLSKAFINKFYPPSKTARIRHEIQTFKQRPMETLSEAWERFRDLLSSCPHYGIPKWMTTQTFFQSLEQRFRDMIVAASGGNFDGMNNAQITELIQNISEMESSYARDVDHKSEVPSKIEMEYKAKLDTLTKEFEEFKLAKKHGESKRANEGGPSHSKVYYVQEPRSPPMHYPPQIFAIIVAVWGTPLSIVHLYRKTTNNKSAFLSKGKVVVERNQERVVERDQGKGKEANEVANTKQASTPEKTINPPIPFPNRSRAMNKEGKFSKFLDMLKKLEVSLPFTEVVTQMPLYTKFLKDVLTKKRSIGGDDLVSLRGECSAILLNPKPEKLQDPGSFSIPCTVGNVSIKRAFCDLGASVSILPLPIAKKVGLHDMIPTSITLQLADRSVQRLMGVIEDVPVKVGNLYIPTDFVVLDILEDQQTSIILGRPFLETRDVNISVKEGKLTFKVGGNVVEFSLTGAMSQSMFESVYSIDMLEEVIEEAKDKCSGSICKKTMKHYHLSWMKLRGRTLLR
ncbi:uncharacterized protein LOC141651666 [Silene latifolia]|uniref:uncharacterized protein LOC141651666 n=1 Tax=Silene latifolia TaxID=37657 RepID=UPI003D76CE75